MYYSLSSASMSLPSAKKGYMGGAVKPSRGRGIVERYIATLKASEGGYIKLAQPIDIGANDDFEITYVFATDAPAYSVLIGNGTTRLFGIEPNGELRAYCGVMNLTSTIIVNDGKLHTATVKRIGNVFSLKVDNENELSVANALVFSELIFEEITKHGTSYSNVTPLELKSTTLNTLTHHYDFNVAKGTTVIPNLAHPLGSELWQNVTPQAYPPTTSTYQNIDEVSLIELSEYALGDVFLVEADIDVIAGRAQILIGNTGRRFDTVGNHRLKYLQKMETSVQLKVRSLESGTEIRINSLSIKKVPNWAEYINVTDDNKEQYEWDAERNAWVGVDNLYKSTPVINGSVSQYGAMQVSPATDSVNQQTKYLVKVDAVNLSGEFVLRVGNAILNNLILRTGDTSTGWVLVDSLDHYRFYLQERSTSGTTADSITVQVYKMLEVAQ